LLPPSPPQAPLKVYNEKAPCYFQPGLNDGSAWNRRLKGS
jgi:hypothetical protein